MSLSRREILLMPFSFAYVLDAQVPLGGTLKLAFDGLGPVRIGMTAKQIRAAIAGPIKSDQETSDPGCYYLEPSVKGVALMMRKGRLGRIDVNEGPWRTTLGAGIGSTEAQVRALYRTGLSVEPHHYTGPVGKYMIVRPRESAYKGLELRFETDGSVVTNFRAGTVEAVGYVEGCL